MKTMKFKTNAKCGGCVSAIGEKLNKIIKAEEWNIDLNSPDKILVVTSDVSPDTIISTVKETGFNIEPL